MKSIMKSELERLRKQINELEQQLWQASEDTFHTVRNGKYIKWIRYRNGKQETIRKRDRKLAQTLAETAFARFRVNLMKQEYKAASAYLKLCPVQDTNAFFDRNPGIRELLNISESLPEQIKKWAEAPYPKNEGVYKGTLYPTLKGDLVRSRAEQMIADALFTAGIPYRYECRLSLPGGAFYYPDFTIMHPVTGEIYLWEHLGMEELDYYRHKNANKLYVYFDNGYVPGKNLICTISNDQYKLTPARVQETIRYYFGL